MLPIYTPLTLRLIPSFLPPPAPPLMSESLRLVFASAGGFVWLTGGLVLGGLVLGRSVPGVGLGVIGLTIVGGGGEHPHGS